MGNYVTREESTVPNQPHSDRAHAQAILDEIVGRTLNEVADHLQTEEIYSKQERDYLLRKLYVAKSISNEGLINEFIEYIEAKYGGP